MLKILLALPAFIYSLIVRIRNFSYNHNICKNNYFRDVFVISIGNLAVGGTGKTPHTEFILKLFNSKYNLAFLSRGYKRSTKGFVKINQNSTASEIGDEPKQISSKFPYIESAVCEDRVLGINKLKNEYNAQVVVLDDAFQHRKLKPTISILLTEYKNPFFKDKFLPLGRLRDNAIEYLRANYIIVTNCPDNLKPIERTIWSKNIDVKPFQKLFFTKVKYLNLCSVFNKNNILYFDKIKDYTAVVFTGIANPKYLLNYYNDKFKKIIEINFQDHKIYSCADMEKVFKTFDYIETTKKIIITTEKDSVKILKLIEDKYKDKIFYQPIEIEFVFDSEEEFKNEILKETDNFFVKKNLL